jgi:hypothetical protein
LADGGGGGEHEDAGRAVRSHQFRADLVPGDDRQVAVEHHHVVVVDRQPLEGGVAVVGHVDGHGVPAQATGDGVGQQPLVLHDQHPHPVIMDGGAVRAV